MSDGCARPLSTGEADGHRPLRWSGHRSTTRCRKPRFPGGGRPARGDYVGDDRGRQRYEKRPGRGGVVDLPSAGEHAERCDLAAERKNSARLANATARATISTPGTPKRITHLLCATDSLAPTSHSAPETSTPAAATGKASLKICLISCSGRSVPSEEARTSFSGAGDVRPGRAGACCTSNRSTTGLTHRRASTTRWSAARDETTVGCGEQARPRGRRAGQGPWGRADAEALGFFGRYTARVSAPAGRRPSTPST